MNRFLNYLIWIAITILIVSEQSCVKDNFKFDRLSTNVKWSPNLAIPGAFATLNLRDLLQDYDSTELFVEDGSGFLYVMYESRVVSVMAKDIIKIPNQEYEETFIVDDLMAVPAGGYYAIKDTIRNFGLTSDERLDSLQLYNCDLNVMVRSTFLHTGLVRVTFPTITMNGHDLVVNVPINTSDGTFLLNVPKSINGSMDLSNNGTTDNKLPITIELFLDGTGNISTGNNAYVNISFNDIDFRAAYGYLGQKNLSIGLDTVNLEMYTNAFAGQAYFEDPRIYAKIHNSYGLPISFKLDNLGAYSNVNQSTYSLNLPSIYNPLIINAPTINQIGESIYTEIKLDKNNCNIQDIISYLPKYIFYSVNASTNPDPNVNNNFVLDTSRFDVDMEVELPLWGHAKYFALQDTTKFNFDEFYDDITDVDWVLIRSNVTNGFPVEIGIQVYFTDSLYHPVDSLFTQETEVISSGKIDTDGKVVQSTLRTTDVIFSRDRLRKMKPVRYALFRGTCSTTNNAHDIVKIYNSYNADIQLAVQVQATVETQNY